MITDNQECVLPPIGKPKEMTFKVMGTPTTNPMKISIYPKLRYCR